MRKSNGSNSSIIWRRWSRRRRGSRKEGMENKRETGKGLHGQKGMEEEEGEEEHQRRKKKRGKRVTENMIHIEIWVERVMSPFSRHVSE